MVRTRASSAGGTLIDSGTLADRPAAGNLNTYYYATDVYMLFRDNGVNWEISGYEPFDLWITDAITEHFGYTPTAGGASPNRLYLNPVAIRYTCTIDTRDIAFTDAGNGNMYLGVYADNGGIPDGGALLATTAQTLTVANQRNNVPLLSNLRMTPGLYWFVGTIENGADTIIYEQLWRSGWPVNPVPMWRDAARGAWAALPNPCPATNVTAALILAQWAHITSIP